MILPGGGSPDARSISGGTGLALPPQHVFEMPRPDSRQRLRSKQEKKVAVDVFQPCLERWVSFGRRHRRNSAQLPDESIGYYVSMSDCLLPTDTRAGKRGILLHRLPRLPGRRTLPLQPGSLPPLSCRAWQRLCPCTLVLCGWMSREAGASLPGRDSSEGRHVQPGEPAPPRVRACR